MKLCIIGFGAVGIGVSRVISMKREMLTEKYDLDISVVAVTDRSGAAIDPNGLDIGKLIETKEKTGEYQITPNTGFQILLVFRY